VEVASAAAVQLKFKIGDRVRVDLDVDVLKAMQEGHGGWHPKMADVRMCAVTWETAACVRLHYFYYCLYFQVFFFFASCSNCPFRISTLR